MPAEAADLLKAYFADRRRGNRFFPPETIHDNSPLVRNVGSATGQIRPISSGEIWHIVNQLYIKAGIIIRCSNWRTHRRKGPDCKQCGYPNLNYTRHELCVHSCRYYFRTRLTALGTNPEYVEFWFGHKNKLYNDVKSTGEDFHRNLYRKADLTITPRPQATKLDLLKQLVTSFGYNPDDVLLRESFSEPHRIVAGPRDSDEPEVNALTRVLKHAVLQELAKPSDTYGRSQYSSSVSADIPRATIGPPRLYSRQIMSRLTAPFRAPSVFVLV